MCQRITTLAIATLSLLAVLSCSRQDPPNIVFIISDDQSWMHTGAAGDPLAPTATFDRIAEQGVLFTNAYVPSPSCSPSRAATLTGQEIWRLGPAANNLGLLDESYATFPALLADAGYFVGFTGKGWGPGVELLGDAPNPAGPEYNKRQLRARGESKKSPNYPGNLELFLNDRPQGQPFCFWIGSRDPHAPYPNKGGPRAKRWAKHAKVPPHLPNESAVRERLAGYYNEISRFDNDVAHTLDILRDRGLLDNTLVIVTSDNGIDLPRCKVNLYDCGTRVPFAAMWPAAVPGDRVVTDFISLADIAPTFLELAGVEVPAAMTGRSFVDVLTSRQDGRVDATRDHVYTARERHSPFREGNTSYPSRALRTDDYLYIVNFESHRWPAGDPPLFGDSGAHPLLSPIIAVKRRDGDPSYHRWNYGKRPIEELYDLAVDPWQLHNVAWHPDYLKTRLDMSIQLTAYLEETGDPRIAGNDGGWDTAPYPRPIKYKKYEPKAPGVEREDAEEGRDKSAGDGTDDPQSGGGDG